MKTSSRRASPSRRAPRKGFTLIEMTVVITILLIIAATIGPRIVAMGNTRNVLSFVNGLGRIASQARESAISENNTAKLTYDASRGVLNVDVEQTNSDGTKGDDKQVGTLTVPAIVQLVDFRVGTDTSSQSDWTVHFYPDGRCEGGGLTSSDAGKIQSLVIDTSGNGSVQDGPLPDTSQDIWQAGTPYTPRTTP